MTRTKRQRLAKTGLIIETYRYCPKCNTQLHRGIGEDEFSSDVLISYDRYSCPRCHFWCEVEDYYEILKSGPTYREFAIAARYRAGDCPTLEMVGRSFHLTRERVMQIIAKYERKTRHKIIRTAAQTVAGRKAFLAQFE